MNDMMFNSGVTSLTSVIYLLVFQISSKSIYRYMYNNSGVKISMLTQAIIFSD